jgi:hypothetical protein
MKPVLATWNVEMWNLTQMLHDELAVLASRRWLGGKVVDILRDGTRFHLDDWDMVSHDRSIVKGVMWFGVLGYGVGCVVVGDVSSRRVS